MKKYMGNTMLMKILCFPINIDVEKANLRILFSSTQPFLINRFTRVSDTAQSS